MSSEFQNNSIFWVEIEKINPNPFQPRREFDPDRLNDLAESIRQYGVLQPLTVTRKEQYHEGEGMTVEYELIAGERRHRAAKIAGLKAIPVIIRVGGEQDDRVKLELAIIENLQREDLNPIERARAFAQLADEFDFKHSEIAKKIGKSREYVSNSVRLLGLPDEMQQKVIEGRLTEGHARPLLMLNDRSEEQQALFKEMIYKKLTVRESETIARKVAVDKVRKKTMDVDPELIALEKKLSESFGTRVHIERKDVGGKIVIDFFSNDDIRGILNILSENLPDVDRGRNALLEKYIARAKGGEGQQASEHDISSPTTASGSQELPEKTDNMAVDAATTEERPGEVRSQSDEELDEEIEKGEDENIGHTEASMVGHPSEGGEGKEQQREQASADGIEVERGEKREKAGVGAFAPRSRNDDEDDELYSVSNFSI